MEVEGLSAPLTGADLRIALKAASKDGQPHLLGVLRRLPGTTASIDLQALVFYANRLARHQRGAQTLIDGGQAERAMSQTARGTQDQQPGWRRRQASLPVPHRPRPLELVIVQPQGDANGRLVLISHGLWDEPFSFEGWAAWLAGRGSRC